MQRGSADRRGRGRGPGGAQTEGQRRDGGTEEGRRDSRVSVLENSTDCLGHTPASPPPLPPSPGAEEGVGQPASESPRGAALGSEVWPRCCWSRGGGRQVAEGPSGHMEHFQGQERQGSRGSSDRGWGSCGGGLQARAADREGEAPASVERGPGFADADSPEAGHSAPRARAALSRVLRRARTAHRPPRGHGHGTRARPTRA